MKDDKTVTNVMFRMLGDSLNPDECSFLLQTNPTLAYSKGESFFVPRVGTGQRWIGLWSLNSESSVKSNDIVKHLEYIVELLFNRKEILNDLSTNKGIRLSICLWIELEEEHGGITVPSKLLMKACSICDDVQIQFLGNCKNDSNP